MMLGLLPYHTGNLVFRQLQQFHQTSSQEQLQSLEQSISNTYHQQAPSTGPKTLHLQRLGLLQLL
jgi:hypothetical protein